MNTSIIGRAIESGKISVSFYNPRDYASEKNKRVDSKPYGGGPGMVIQAEPVIKAIKKAKGRKKNVRVVFFTPGGNQFDSKVAEKWASKHKHLILVAGRYEGIDERARKAFLAEEISIGPYTLTGGELPAMVVLDAVSRRLPGVLGDDYSVEEKRTSSRDVYTRPESFKYKGKEYSVPKVLLSGDHKKIDEWRAESR